MKSYYAIVVKNKNKYNSYFGLTQEEIKLVKRILNNLSIEYDIYKFKKEIRFKRKKNLILV